ncbi:MAG: O-antigen ligase family protein [Candidatus Omnitrophica bacterium]|nr:O-antigen ligase family protein [Candidatus Omnitrophota bacterium]
MFVKVSSYLSLGLIAVLSLCYSLYGSDVAELNVQLPGLSFPIFIGEILMFFCVLVFALQLMLEKPAERSLLIKSRWFVCAAVYMGWVIIKAGTGFLTGGAYALRNAALFYYPVFMILVAYFVTKIRTDVSNIPGVINLLLAFLFTYFATIRSVGIVIFLMFALFFSSRIAVRWLRWASIGTVAYVFYSQFRVLSCKRAVFLGLIVSAVFFFWYGGQALRLKVWRQLVGVMVIGGAFVLVLAERGDTNAFRSIIDWKPFFSRFHDEQLMVAANAKTFVPDEIVPKVYHNNRNAVVVSRPHDSFLRNLVPADVHKTEPVNTGTFDPVVPEGKDSSLARKNFRNIGSAYGNGTFRMFIWKDMFTEMYKEHPVLGFSFGKPQRSISLEILNEGELEWSRDGWIAPHNSFFHLIYRAGIVGIALIGLIFFAIGRLAADFLKARAWRGALLLCMLIYWIVTAQFGVVLELPYYAIPFWSVFGLSWAYRNHLFEAAPKREG